MPWRVVTGPRSTSGGRCHDCAVAMASENLGTTESQVTGDVHRIGEHTMSPEAHTRSIEPWLRVRFSVEEAGSSRCGSVNTPCSPHRDRHRFPDCKSPLTQRVHAARVSRLRSCRVTRSGRGQLVIVADFSLVGAHHLVRGDEDIPGTVTSRARVTVRSPTRQLHPARTPTPRASSIRNRYWEENRTPSMSGAD